MAASLAVEGQGPSAPVKGVFLGDGTVFEPVALVGEPADVDGATFIGFKDPVLAPTTGSLAFIGTMNGAGVNRPNDNGVWWLPRGGQLTLLARQGKAAADSAAGVRWKTFRAIAVPGGTGGAPLITATLERGGGGVSAENDQGLWGVDSAGVLRLLVREGDVVNGKVLRSFEVSNAAPGVAGVTRSFNNSRDIIFRATFTDRSHSILRLQIP
jgi:hypothetical protein